MSPSEIFQLIVSFLYYPCFILYQWPGQRRRKAAEDEEKQIQLAARAARLLPPRIGMPVGQSQSSLLQKLPLELRRKISEYALGGSAIHVWGFVTKEVGSRECWSDVDEPFCTYTEAAESLYSSNTFCVSIKQGYRNPFPNIVTFVIAERRQAIRSIRIEYTLNPDIEDLSTTIVVIIDKDLRAIKWTWENVAALRGLRHLVVDLVLDKDSSLMSRETVVQLYADWEAEILEPVKALPTPLKSFRMRVPWESEEVVRVGEKAYHLE
ncbi:uncharacterized protein BDZ99DRAFT_565511 [Mytilinidion resinicola]|uniref:DUF7730 domain-containing protein n=1 Tax=Mytilinidion resinicola TaxID=574789 RepID=A0A6A6ZCI7_9PEZI|nr:uncharacterized protein BDZ99DRAFT_565511 [Mytilinidion resinicola]KAF2817917.1 hypothetical protein BDZ99DRAFT_565511 [Mytilinidion resinicola]